jgi:type IV pilus assembly protein PilY1
MTKIASLGCDTTSSCTAPRKFMFAPSVVSRDGTTTLTSEYVLLLGSGDREKPLTYYAATASVTNYFFVFTDKPGVASSTYPGSADCGTAIICKDSLLGKAVATAINSSDLTGKKGWYQPLAATEQVVTTAITIFGVVTYSTHQPAVSVSGACSANLGKTLVYNQDFETGASANGTSLPYQDVSGDGLPPSPVAGKVTLDDGTTVPFCIGCNKDSPLEGEEKTGSSAFSQPKGRLYWYIQR